MLANNRRWAILWESCGPYHFSRLVELRALIGTDALLAIELSPLNLTYSWRMEDRALNQVHSLFPKWKSEEVPLLAFMVKLRRLLNDSSVDVLFVPSYWPAYSILAALVAKSLGIRVVFMGDSHYASGTNTGFAIIFKRLLIRAYDSALVAGSLHRSFLRYLGMPPEKIFDGYDTVDNGHFQKVADEARVDALSVRQRLGVPEKYILSLGRFVSKKNLDSVVRAYALLVSRKAHYDHALVFVGSGPVQDRLMSLAASLGLKVDVAGQSVITPSSGEGKVYFFPFAQIETVPAYYALATAFVLASTSDEWGLVVNEAMACACPVIVSRSVGSSLDLVVPEKTGYRFVPDNIHELAWCLETLCADREKAREMGLAAREHIAAWSNERFARNAVRAAKAALGDVEPPSTVQAERGGRATPTVWFLQTCFPDYRTPVFTRLVERLGERFHLLSGTSYFTPDIKTNPDYMEWHSLVENRFFFKRKFLWQRGAIAAMLEPEVAVLELNPRVFSNWIILAARALWGAPTLLWGHAWGRDDAGSVRNVLRLYMMRLASGTITYTRSQRKEVESVFPRFRLFAATNSLIRAADCVGESARIEEMDTIIYVGRLNGPKKPSLLIEGFRRARLPQSVVLKLVGEGDARAALESQIADHNLQSRVQLLGHVHNHEILKSLYKRSVCAVSAGYVGLGAIQAFSFGVPLVLADNEPHAPEVEACRAGENTVYFTANDADSLAVVLEKMWQERSGWLARRAELAKWTAENYSVEAMVEGFVEAIEAVCPSKTVI